MKEPTPNVINYHQNGHQRTGILFQSSRHAVQSISSPFRFICFQQCFVWVLNAFKRFRYTYKCLFSSLSSLRPFTFRYENILSRRNMLLCATSERDYKQQHWTEKAQHHQTNFRPSSPSTPILRYFLEYWMSLDWKNVLNKNCWYEYYCQPSQKNKGLI